MVYLLVGTAILIICLLLLRWRGTQPVKHRVNIAQGDFRKYLEVLLKRGYDRGFMMVEAPDRNRFIQFSKYLDDSKHMGLQFDFPNAPWSREYFEALKNLLKQRDYYCDIQQVNPSPNHKEERQVREFIVVDLKMDLDRGFELCTLVLQEVFKLNASEMVTIWFEDVSVFDELVSESNPTRQGNFFRSR